MYICKAEKSLSQWYSDKVGLRGLADGSGDGRYFPLLVGLMRDSTESDIPFPLHAVALLILGRTCGTTWPQYDFSCLKCASEEKDSKQK